VKNKFHTIQSSDKNEFDERINRLLELGCELMDGSYEVINNENGIVYSQVIIANNCRLSFYDSGDLEIYFPLNDEGKRNGLCTWYYENGQISSEGTFKDGKQNGLFIGYYLNGKKKSERTVIDGKINGLWIEYYENGQKKTEEPWEDDRGIQNGLYTEWWENGKKKAELYYKDGYCIESYHWNSFGMPTDGDFHAPYSRYPMLI